MSATRQFAPPVEVRVWLAITSIRGLGAGARMIYFCYIYSLGSDVPHMEALSCASLSEARARCRRMLNDHGAATRAELFDDDERVAVISRDEDQERQAQG